MTEMTRRDESELPIGELLDRITEGHRLLVLTPSQTTARRRLIEVGDVITEEGPADLVVRIRRANGLEAIEHPASGGRIWFRTVTTASVSLHGLPVDAIYLEDCDPDATLLVNAGVAMVLSPLAEVITC